MKKTVCEFVYVRYPSSSGLMISEFSHALFMGDYTKEYKEKLNKAVLNEFYKIEEEIELLRMQTNELYAEYESLNDDRTFFQKLIRSRNTPNWKRKAELDVKIEEAERKLITTSTKHVHRDTDVIFKTHDFLQGNGFVITNHCVNGDRFKTHYEIWTREV